MQAKKCAGRWGAQGDVEPSYGMRLNCVAGMFLKAQLFVKVQVGFKHEEPRPAPICMARRMETVVKAFGLETCATTRSYKLENLHAGSLRPSGADFRQGQACFPLTGNRRGRLQS